MADTEPYESAFHLALKELKARVCKKCAGNGKLANCGLFRNDVTQWREVSLHDCTRCNGSGFEFVRPFIPTG